MPKLILFAQIFFCVGIFIVNSAKIISNKEEGQQRETANGAKTDSTSQIPYIRNYYKKFPSAEPERTVILHLTDWSYEDIEKECSEYLGPQGYAAVQISPVTRHANNDRLSVASYEIENNSGNEITLKNMIQGCNKANVRVIIEVVLNNMMKSNENGPCEDYQDKYPKKQFGPCNEPPDFYEKHFHKDENVLTENDYRKNKDRIRTGQLDGRLDLLQVIDDVPNIHQFEFLYKLLNMGAAGFKIVNADHMDPNELVKLFDSLPDLNFEKTPTRPFIYCDVYTPYHDRSKNEGNWIIQDREYIQYTRVTDYSYARELAKSFKWFQNDLRYFDNWGTGWDLVPGDDSVVFTHTAMTQIYGSRGVTPYPKVDYNFINPLILEHDKAFKLATAFMLSHIHGIPVLTSKYVKLSSLEGIKTENDLIKVAPEHRSPKTKIDYIVRWRNEVVRANGGTFPVVEKLEDRNWKSIDAYQVAYCVGTTGFVVINNAEKPISQLTLKTCFKSPGIYCDIFSGGKKEVKTGDDISGVCVNNGISVNENGWATLNGEGWEGVLLFSSVTANVNVKLGDMVDQAVGMINKITKV